MCPVGATVRMVGAPVALVVAETPRGLRPGWRPSRSDMRSCRTSLSPTRRSRRARPTSPVADNVLTSFAVQHGDLDARRGFRRPRRGRIPYRLPGARRWSVRRCWAITTRRAGSP